MINVWTKYDEPRLYGNGETHLITLLMPLTMLEKQYLCLEFSDFRWKRDKNKRRYL